VDATSKTCLFWVTIAGSPLRPAPQQSQQARVTFDRATRMIRLSQRGGLRPAALCAISIASGDLDRVIEVGEQDLMQSNGGRMPGYLLNFLA